MRPVRQRGFTLIELMIVVVIASILASIAIPSYLNQTRQARRAEAKQLLLDAASRQERIFSEFGQYTATVGSGGSNCGPQNNQTCGLNLGTGISSNSFYELTITQPTNNTSNSARFSMTATALGDQTNDACGDFTLNQQGVRGVGGSTTMSAQQCWSR